MPLPGGAASTRDRTNCPADAVQTAAAASLQPHLPSPSSGHRLLKALGGSWEPELLHPRNHNPCLSCQALPGLRPCTGVMPLDHGAAPQGWMLQATTSKHHWSLLENHLPCPARDLQKSPAFYFIQTRSLLCRWQVPRAAASLPFPKTPHSRHPPRSAFQEQTRMCHGAKPKRTPRDQPPHTGSPGSSPAHETAALEQPTTTNSCVSDKGKNSARKQYSAQLFPSAYCK